MEEKRMFQILDEMNQSDAKNKTQLVAVGNTFLRGDKVKGGASISMGMPESALFDIITESKIPLLLLVDKKDYFSRKGQLDPLPNLLTAVQKWLDACHSFKQDNYNSRMEIAAASTRIEQAQAEVRSLINSLKQ